MSDREPVPEVLSGGVLCRTCMRPIVFETRTEPGHLPLEAWYDDAHIDQRICFRAVDYRHVPLSAREAAYYNAGYRAAKESSWGLDDAREALARCEALADQLWREGVRSTRRKSYAQGTAWKSAASRLRDALRGADA